MTSYFTDALFTEVVRDIMDKEGVDESTAQSMLYTGGYTIEATVNPKMQTAMENLMRNEGDAYFPAGWHEEEVTSISDDDVQVMNADGTPKTRTGDDGTVYYYRNVRTQAAMVTLDYDGNVLAMVGGLGEKTKSLSLNRAYSVTRQTGSTIKPIGAYALGVEYGLVNWSTMLNNSPLYQKQDMVIRMRTTAAKTADGPFRQSAQGLPQRMAQLAPQLRRQLWRWQRPAPVERSGPLPEHHRHPGGRPGGRKQHLQLCLQHPAADHPGPRQRCGSCPDGHGQPDPRRDPHGAGRCLPDLL